MHPAAQSAWYPFIKQHEGEIAYMYLDTKGLVTTGIGNLIDPATLALDLPFQFKVGNRLHVAPGTVATRAQIQTEWAALKNHAQRDSFIRGGAKLCGPETDLELTDAGRQALFDRKSLANEADLTQAFADFARWPADAQLGLMAMAWGLGSAFPASWPMFSTACRKQDFNAASAECNISSWRTERNAASHTLFSNAAYVLANVKTHAVTQLYYPAKLGAAAVVS